MNIYSKKQKRYFLVLKNIRITKDYFLLKLMSEDFLPLILPAQFVEIKVPDSPEAFLRRPISIHDVNYDKNTISLLINIVGPGTLNLSHIQKGRLLDIIFPLGNSFSPPSYSSKPLIVGGGVGVAPMLYTAKYFMQFGIESTILLGFRSKDNIVRKEKFEKYGKVFFSTDDGSYGEKGHVLQHSLFNSEHFRHDIIYACGPTIMLKNLSKWANQRNITCEVSLENLMACGIGACLCCVQNTVDGHRCVCTDGPVFNSKNVIW